MFKCYENRISKGVQKRQVEVELCQMADLVVGVGPKQTEAFRKYLASKKDQDIFELTPGVFAHFTCVEWYEKSLRIAREAYDLDAEGKAYLNLGAVYESRNDLPKAMEWYEKSLRIAREACDRATEGKAYVSLGLVYGFCNDLPKAIECYDCLLYTSPSPRDA